MNERGEGLQEKEKMPFVVTSKEQLVADYSINLWPIVNDPKAEKERIDRSWADAEKLIQKQGGLTQPDLEILHFFKNGEMPRNDM